MTMTMRLRRLGGLDGSLHLVEVDLAAGSTETPISAAHSTRYAWHAQHKHSRSMRRSGAPWRPRAASPCCPCHITPRVSPLEGSADAQHKSEAEATL
eukprot:3941623-Rhodomonas_salina.4